MPVTASQETKINRDPVTDEYWPNPEIVISPSKLCTFPTTKTTIDLPAFFQWLPALAQAPAESSLQNTLFCVFNH